MGETCFPNSLKLNC